MAYLAAAVLLLMGAFAWGLLRIRRGRAQAWDALRAIGVDDVPGLLDECVAGFARMGERLVLDDADGAAALLDRSLSGGLLRLKLAFARPGCDWYFVLPVGAALGELLRRAGDGHWQPAEGGGLCLVLRAGEGTATAHPFDKVLQLGTAGEAGTITAYVAAGRALARGELAGEALP